MTDVLNDAGGNPPPGKPPRRRRGRILYALMAVLVFVGFVPLGSVVWKLVSSNREALTTAQQEYQLLLARSIAREVEIEADGLRSRIGRIAQGLAGPSARGSIGADTFEKLVSSLAEPNMLQIDFVDRRGRRMVLHNAAALPEGLAPLLDAAVDRRFAELSPDDEVRLSTPTLVGEGAPRAALVASVPVVHRKRLTGVLAVAVDLQPFWDTLAAENRAGHTIYAVDRTGVLFASSDSRFLDAGHPIRRSSMVQRFLSGEGRAIETMPFELDENGQRAGFIGSYTATDTGWGIFVQARQDQVYHPVTVIIQQTLSLALAAFGVAVIVSVFFAGTISKPIDRLAAASRAFATGDFSARVDVTSRNEIGELAETFNKMAEEIEGYIRRLKSAIAENNELFLGTIRALAQAIDAKDPYTRGHSVRVNKYSVIISRYLGLSNETIRDIHVSSLLHDVGKIGIDDAILKKPGVLTDEEFEIMKTHPVLGANIMAPIRQMKTILPGLRYHHERVNGAGYPDGLRADDIPLMARIIAVADSFDAMTTNRPYQRPMTFATAASRINELKGTAFDDRIVEAFNRAYQAGEFRQEEEEARRQVAATA